MLFSNLFCQNCFFFALGKIQHKLGVWCTKCGASFLVLLVVVFLSFSSVISASVLKTFCEFDENAVAIYCSCSFDGAKGVKKWNLLLVLMLPKYFIFSNCYQFLLVED